MSESTAPMPVLEVQAYANADMPASVGGAQRLARELLALRTCARALVALVDSLWEYGPKAWPPKAVADAEALLPAIDAATDPDVAAEFRRLYREAHARGNFKYPFGAAMIPQECPGPDATRRVPVADSAKASPKGCDTASHAPHDSSVVESQNGSGVVPVCVACMETHMPPCTCRRVAQLLASERRSFVHARYCEWRPATNQVEVLDWSFALAVRARGLGAAQSLFGWASRVLGDWTPYPGGHA